MYAEIQAALDAQLATVTGLPELQRENTRLNRGGRATTPFTRATFLPGQATQLTVGQNGVNRYSGLYQVDLFYPMDTGAATINAMADSVLAAFPRATVLGDEFKVHCTIAWREAGRRDEPFYAVPVLVQWTTIA